MCHDYGRQNTVPLEVTMPYFLEPVIMLPYVSKGTLQI